MRDHAFGTKHGLALQDQPARVAALLLHSGLHRGICSSGAFVIAGVESGHHGHQMAGAGQPG
ncbi:MAG TPA: hypothetical protein VFL86_29985, partial [Burkholderiaceae bacterium]|nr:hypothetical protein [Burkholderiaceae bacterium]